MIRNLCSCFSTTDSDSDGSSFLGSNSLASNATEYDLIAPLAVLLYEVLDYRLEDSEERELSADIANLIEVMLDAGSEVHLVGELSNKLYFLLKLHLTQYPPY